MSSGCCDVRLDVTALENRQRRVLVTVLAINVVAFVVMATGSVLSGSSSLLSGTLDNLGDALTYGLSLAVVGSSRRAKARVAFFKGMLIAAAAIVVAIRVFWHILHPEVPIVETMGSVALLNLTANFICLYLLTPHRHSDINMSSVWECSRNDMIDGIAVLFASISVWLFGSAWPDILVAIILLIVFSKSAVRVLRGAWNEMYPHAG